MLKRLRPRYLRRQVHLKILLFFAATNTLYLIILQKTNLPEVIFQIAAISKSYVTLLIQISKFKINGNLSVTMSSSQNSKLRIILDSKTVRAGCKNTVNSNKNKSNNYLINVSNHNCMAIHPKVVLYNRIFKTASTTMTSMLEDCSEQLHYDVQKGDSLSVKTFLLINLQDVFKIVKKICGF